MARSWRTVRVFISSTFRDMHAERDHLIKAVFPELRELLERHRIHLVDIDLRWGVTVEQADNDRVLDLCLDEIKRSRPFFLGILGQRYGWVPKSLPEASVKKHGWLQGLADRSITELEILHGVLNDPKMRMHSMFYFRKDDFLGSVPQEVKDRVFLDALGDKLKSVKDAIHKHCQNYGAPLREYPCAWDPDKPNPEDATLGRITGLEEFGQMVKKDLLAALSREFPELVQEAPAAARPGTEDWLAEEQDFHERFIEARLQVYVGRDKVHRQLMDYLEGDSTGPLLLSGGSGTGKSSILGRLWEEWSKDHPEDFVLPHFIGASPFSTDIGMTLRRFCLALKERFKLADEVPDQLEKLPDAFREFLQAVPEGSRAVLLIDAVNQLDVYVGSHDMTWLPDALPARVKVVVSCIDESEKEQAALHALRARNTKELKVEPLSNEERFEIVSLVPSVSAKSLDPKQTALLLDNPATTNPLYLTVALEELRGFGSFEKLNERIKSFPRADGENGLVELFLQVLARLESEHGQSTVHSALSSIAASRHGLSEKELSEILNRVQLGKEGPADRSGEMLLALRQLRPYLLRRGPYVDFYHRNLYKAVRERYLSREDVRLGIHQALAEYFFSKGLGSDRMLSETAHHMRGAGMWDRLSALLTDLPFIEAKCANGMASHLVADYAAALSGDGPGPEQRRAMGEFEAFVREQLHVLAGFPSLTFQQAANEPAEKAPSAAARKRLETGAETRPWLRLASQARGDSGCLLTLSGHGSPVTACALAPDGLRAVTGDSGGELRWWDLADGSTRSVRSAHGGTVTACVFSPDGGTVLSSSKDKTLKLWKADDASLLRTLSGYDESVLDCAFSPDGKRILACTMQGVNVWDAAAASEPRSLVSNQGGLPYHSMTVPEAAGMVTHESSLACLALSPDGRWAATASCWVGTIKLWDAATGREARTLGGGSDQREWNGRSAGPCAFSPDGTLLAAVMGASRTVKVWDLETGGERLELGREEDPLDACAFCPRGTQIATASQDGTLKIWDPADGSLLAKAAGHLKGVTDCAYSCDGTRILSASKDKTVKLWDVARLLGCQGKEREGFRVHARSRDGRILASDHSGAVLLLANEWASEGLPLKGLTSRYRGTLAASFSSDGGCLVTNDESSLQAWDAAAGLATSSVKGEFAEYPSCELSPDGARVLARTGPEQVTLWEVPGLRKVAAFAALGINDRLAFFSPDGSRVIACASSDLVKVFEAETGREVGSFGVPGSKINRCLLSPDGSKLLTFLILEWDRRPLTRAQRLTKIWDTATGSHLADISAHDDNDGKSLFSPDGTRILTWENTSRLEIWDAGTGRKLAALGDAAPGRGIEEVVFSPDGRRIACHRDRYWREADGPGAVIRDWEGDGPAADLAGEPLGFSPDSGFFLTADDGALILWDVKTGAERARYIGRWGVRWATWSRDGRTIAAHLPTRTYSYFPSEDLADQVHVLRLENMEVGPPGSMSLPSEPGSDAPDAKDRSR